MTLNEFIITAGIFAIGVFLAATLLHMDVATLCVGYIIGLIALSAGRLWQEFLSSF